MPIRAVSYRSGQAYASAEVKAAYDRAYALCGQVGASAEKVTSLCWLASYNAAKGNLSLAVSVSRQMLSVVDQEAVSEMYRMQAHLLAEPPLFYMGCNDAAPAHFDISAVLLYNVVN